MIAKVQKWGNSQGLRLAKRVLEDARLSVDDQVDVAVRDGMIVIVPLKRVRGKVRLKDLVSHIPGDYKARELDWGKPAGREAW